MTSHSWRVAQPGLKPEMGGTPESLLGHHTAAGTVPPEDGSTTPSGTFFLGDGRMKQLQPSAGKVLEQAFASNSLELMNSNLQCLPTLQTFKMRTDWTLPAPASPRKLTACLEQAQCVSKNILEWDRREFSQPRSLAFLSCSLTSKACWESKLDFEYHKSERYCVHKASFFPF